MTCADQQTCRSEAHFNSTLEFPVARYSALEWHGCGTKPRPRSSQTDVRLVGPRLHQRRLRRRPRGVHRHPPERNRFPHLQSPRWTAQLRGALHTCPFRSDCTASARADAAGLPRLAGLDRRQDRSVTAPHSSSSATRTSSVSITPPLPRLSPGGPGRHEAHRGMQRSQQPGRSSGPSWPSRPHPRPAVGDADEPDLW